MLYNKKNPVEKKRHVAYHDKLVNGIKIQPINSERIIWEDNKNRIIVITPTSRKCQKKRAGEVAGLANRDMSDNQGSNYDLPSYESDVNFHDLHNTHAFLYCHCNRAAGLAIFESCDNKCYCSLEKIECGERLNYKRGTAIWTCMYIWVHRKYRCRKIAFSLLNAATKYFSINLNDIGIYPPLSPDGKHFFCSLFPKGSTFATHV